MLEALASVLRWCQSPVSTEQTRIETDLRGRTLVCFCRFASWYIHNSCLFRTVGVLNHAVPSIYPRRYHGATGVGEHDRAFSFMTLLCVYRLPCSCVVYTRRFRGLTHCLCSACRITWGFLRKRDYPSRCQKAADVYNRLLDI